MAPPLEVTHRNFAKIFGIGKLESLGVRPYLHDLMFSHFGTVLACDRQRHEHMTTACQNLNQTQH